MFPLKTSDLQRIFRELDKNGDGFVSLEELVNAFNVFDLNGDGFISTEELQSVLSKLGLWNHKNDGIVSLEEPELDKNGEGFVSLEELVNAFNMFDLNGDGFISSEELQSMLSRLGLWNHKSDGFVSLEDPELDKNGEGFVSLEELVNAFNMFDLNGYGFISSEELQSVLSRLGLSNDKGDGFVSLEDPELDKNGEGFVSLEELVNAFNMFDLNGDGFISSEELQSVLSRLGLSNDKGDGFVSLEEPELDKNGDGFVSLKELVNAFNMFDLNGDGFISSEELQSVLSRLGLWNDKSDGFVSLDEPELDKNGDSFVSLEELVNAFNVLDLNGDGFISLEELQSVLSSLGLSNGKSDGFVSLEEPELDKNGDGFMSLEELVNAFNVFDLNSDGFISSAELQCMLSRLGLWNDKSDIFVSLEELELDKNGDSFVNLEEPELDKNGDGFVSLEELVNAFNVFDLNGDGFISSEELQSLLSRLGLSNDKGDGFVSREEPELDKNGDGFVSLEELVNAFNVFDLNGDGFISSEALQSMFSRLGLSNDKNDGFVSLEEPELDTTRVFEFNSAEMVYTYDSVIHGYSIRLPPEEAVALENQPGTLSVLPEMRYELHTTPTSESNSASEVIIGVLDTGVCSESKSYDDTGLGPVPSNWKGICDSTYSHHAILIDDEENDNNHSSSQSILRVGHSEVTLGWIFVITNFCLEVISSVLDQLSSVHKPLYALLAMIFSFGGMLISIVDLVFKGRTQKVSWRWKEKLPWFYYPSQSHQLPFGTFKDITGFICALCQCIVTAINYIDDNKPIKISVWPIIFAFGQLYSKILENP